MLDHSTTLRVFMKPSTKRALIAAAVAAVVSGFLTTPDLITQIMAAIISFAVIVGVLLLLLRVLPVATWSSVRQRTFTWLVAVGTGASFVFLPPLIRVLTR